MGYSATTTRASCRDGSNVDVELAVGLEASTPPKVSLVTGSTPRGELRDIANDAADPLRIALHRHFGFFDFRECQREVCDALLRGEDVLLVMPTGAGKSLCYQLPGVARLGTCIVLSPLIALMEDQVAKLQSLGLSAERVHSGRTRAQSRQVCIDYLEGRLDFLFIAPERLAVPRFASFLARRTPSLIAVDEAHCISEWGHDFRPDYRNLQQHLRNFPDTPIVAMTATATAEVQRDIVAELGLRAPKRFVHGFQRDNLAMEVCEVPSGHRVQRLKEVFGQLDALPAIVYVPTRKAAEQIAEQLSSSWTTACYHAGMSNEERGRVHTEFLSGGCEIVVATCAYGMGIDKADIRTVAHVALPTTLEAYYQEIGRAGRDGLPSRAILMKDGNDRRALWNLWNRTQPPASVLQRVYRGLPARELRVAEIQIPHVQGDFLTRALLQLERIGCLERDARRDSVRKRDAPSWEIKYEQQRARKEKALHQVFRFSEAESCRMASLVQHFDPSHANHACGICDVCSPALARARRFRAPTNEELGAIGTVVRQLRQTERITTKSAWIAAGASGVSISKSDFERAVRTLERKGIVKREARPENDTSMLCRGPRWKMEAAALSSAVQSIDYQVDDEPRDGANCAIDSARLLGANGHEMAADPGDGLAALLAENLRQWREKVASVREVPLYRVLTNRALDGIVQRRPANSAQLQAIHGIGETFIREFSADVLEIVRCVR